MFFQSKSMSPGQSGRHCFFGFVFMHRTPQQPNSRKFPRRRAEWIFLSTVFFTKIPLEPPLRRKLGRPAPRLCDLGLLICRSASPGTDLHRPNATRLRTSRSRGPHQVANLLLDFGFGFEPAWKRFEAGAVELVSKGPLNYGL